MASWGRKGKGAVAFENDFLNPKKDPEKMPHLPLELVFYFNVMPGTSATILEI